MTAYVEWDGERIVAKGKVKNEALIFAISLDQNPHHFICEMVACYGMAVGKEVFETCVWIGRFMQASPSEMKRKTRGEVKMHLCHSMRAKDANIRQALIDRLGPPGTKKNPGVTFGVSGDMWAALALAVTEYDLTQKLTTQPHD